MRNNIWLRSLLAAGLLAGGAAVAQVQDFPTKPLRIVLHVPPGSGTDLITRTIGAAMGRFLGQSVVIENRPGASGLIAYEHVAKQAPADGYTLVTGGSQHATLKIFVKDLRFDPMKDLAPVSMFGEGVQLLAASSAAPFNTFAEFIAYARANPGKVAWGTSGFTTTAMLNTYSILQRHGIEVTHVPFAGNAPARPALMSNTIQLLWHTEGDYHTDSAEKRIKAILVCAPERLKSVASVPTSTELGHPELVGFYYGLSVPGATPKPALDRLAAAVQFAVKQQEVLGYAAKYLIRLTGFGPEQSRRRLQELADNYTAIAAKANIKPK